MSEFDEIKSFSCSTGYFDGTFTLKYLPADAGRYHVMRVYLVKGNSLMTLRTQDLRFLSAVEITISFKLNDEELSRVYRRLSDTAFGGIQVRIRSYTDERIYDIVGDSGASDTIALEVPKDVLPTAKLSVETVNDNEFLASNGILVSGFSKAKLTLDSVAGNGASVKGTMISGRDFNISGSNATVSFAASGRYSFVGTVTDTRSRSANDGITVDVLPYSKPYFTSVVVERGIYSSGEWTSNDSGPDVRVCDTVALALTEYGNSGSIACYIDGKEVLPVPIKDGSVAFRSVDGEQSHILTEEVIDSLGQSGKISVTIPPTSVTVEYGKEGDSISFGKPSEKKGFECGMDTEFYGEVLFSAEADALERTRKSLGMFKTLWSGEWSSGAITVPGLNNYSIYRLTIKGAATLLIAFRNGTYFRAFGGYYVVHDDKESHRTYALAASVGGDDMTMIGFTEMNHYASGSHGAQLAMTVTKIEGIL